MQKFSEKFQQYWIQFSQQLQLEQHIADQLFQLLLQAYTEPQRAYHTVQHIVECLELFHQVKPLLKDSVAVEMAIWFHDVIYNSQASDNEECSADLMKSLCNELMDQEQLEKVYRWIVATKKHQLDKDDDLNYLLDMDLAILGSQPQRFTEYEQQIRQEYSWVEPELYALKRAAVLKHFYLLQPLFQTEYFSTKLEQQAKLNLNSML